MNITVNNTWPDISLPFIDYTGTPHGSTLVSDTSFGRIARRNRFRPVYQVLSIRIKLNTTDHDTFRSFYIDDLGNGTATFALELRFPKNTALANWQVRFLNALRETYDDGM